MLAWDGKKGTGFKYIYGSLAMMMPTLSFARRTYVALQPVLRQVKLVSISSSFNKCEIEVQDLMFDNNPTVITVERNGIIMAGAQYTARRNLTNYLKEWNNEIHREGDCGC